MLLTNFMDDSDSPVMHALFWSDYTGRWEAVDTPINQVA